MYCEICVMLLIITDVLYSLHYFFILMCMAFSSSSLICMFQPRLNSIVFFCLDSSLYANHVFNVFDHDRDGKVSFEVILFL